MLKDVEAPDFYANAALLKSNHFQASHREGLKER